MIRSCIFVFYIAVIAVSARRRTIRTRSIAIVKRSRSATRAAAIWNERLTAIRRTSSRPGSSRARSTGWAPTACLKRDRERPPSKRALLRHERRLPSTPSRPDGHFWMAANMGALAESFGLRQGHSLSHTRFAKSLERVLKIDAPYLDGSADRALGRWYYKVPGLFGGDKRKSETHLRKALSYAPESIISHLFLAETLIDLDRPARGAQSIGSGDCRAHQRRLGARR